MYKAGRVYLIKCPMYGNQEKINTLIQYWGEFTLF